MPTYELNFKDYLRILQKRYWILLVSILLFSVGALVHSSLQKLGYRSAVTVRIEERKTLVGEILNRPIYYRGMSNYLISEMRVIRSRPVAQKTAQRLGLIKESMSEEEANAVISKVQAAVLTAGVEKTDLVKIIVITEEAQQSARIANMTAQVYKEENLKQKNREARKSREFIQEQLVKVEQNLGVSEDSLRMFKEKETVSGVGVALISRLVELEARLAETLTRATEKHPDALGFKEQIASIREKLKRLPESELEFVRLNRDVQVHDKLYRMLRDKLEEARILEAEQVSDVTIINPAGDKGALVGPNKLNSLAMGFLIGAIIGLILMLVIENLDTSIGTIEDVENYIKLPVLGVIPSLKIEREKRQADKNRPIDGDASSIVFIACEEPTSPFAEAFRILRTNLKLEREKNKVLLITSTGPQEGKTTVLVGLGLALSKMGLNTLLVDTDLRRPAVAKVFGLEREPGINELLASGLKYTPSIVKNFTDILIGKLGFDYVSKLSGLETLSILTSGSLTANSSEILSSPAMKRLVGSFKETFDIVIFDSPPALSVTDASILSRHVDGVIIVYEMGRTSRDALLRTKIQLESVGAKILGVILNHTRPQTEFQTSYYPYYRSYKYKYYYHNREGSEKKEG